MFTIIWLVFRFFDPLELDVRERHDTRFTFRFHYFRVECAVMRVSMYSIVFLLNCLQTTFQKAKAKIGDSQKPTPRKWFKKLSVRRSLVYTLARARVHDYRTLRVITNHLLRKRFFALSTHPIPSRNRALGLSSKPWSASLSTMKKQSASSTLSPIRRFVKHCF